MSSTANPDIAAVVAIMQRLDDRSVLKLLAIAERLR